MEAQTRAVNSQIWFALNVGKYVSFLTSNYLLPKREMRRNLEVSKYFIQHEVIIFYFPAIMIHLSFWPPIFTRIARIKLETWNLIQEREIKGIIELYIGVSRPGKFLMQPFLKKRYFDQASLQLQGEGKNYLSRFFL